jgi:hypothetical protein
MSCGDGGIVANNPTSLAINEGVALWGPFTVRTVVSLGTGKECFDTYGAFVLFLGKLSVFRCLLNLMVSPETLVKAPTKGAQGSTLLSWSRRARENIWKLTRGGFKTAIREITPANWIRKLDMLAFSLEALTTTEKTMNKLSKRSVTDSSPSTTIA